VATIASLGMPDAPVRRRPVVAILSTGDEVVPPGQPLGPGQIYSSNNLALAGLVRAAGGVPRDHGNAPDDLDGLVERLRACLDADVVVTTGGVSVGAYDFVKEAYQILGAEMDRNYGAFLRFNWFVDFVQADRTTSRRTELSDAARFRGNPLLGGIVGAHFRVLDAYLDGSWDIGERYFNETLGEATPEPPPLDAGPQPSPAGSSSQP